MLELSHELNVWYVIASLPSFQVVRVSSQTAHLGFCGEWRVSDLNPPLSLSRPSLRQTKKKSNMSVQFVRISGKKQKKTSTKFETQTTASAPGLIRATVIYINQKQKRSVSVWEKCRPQHHAVPCSHALSSSHNSIYSPWKEINRRKRTTNSYPT